MIHRAPFGSLERFVAVLIEHCAGKFPLWLAPEQCVVLPISEKYNDYAKEVIEELNQNDVRSILDDRNEKIGKKIREAEMNKTPYLIVVGESEMNDKKITVRKQGQGEEANSQLMTVSELKNSIFELINNQLNNK
jgi:threonyl-tRNA synthetase